MDPDRFDTVAKSFAAARPRRALLTALAGSALGTILAAIRAKPAGATHIGCRHAETLCRRDRQCCSGRCRGGRCRCPRGAGWCFEPGVKQFCGPPERANCLCAAGASGGTRCGGFSNTPPLVPCPRRSQCNNDRQCLPGQFCARGGPECCGRGINLCVPLCH